MKSSGSVCWKFLGLEPNSRAVSNGDGLSWLTWRSRPRMRWRRRLGDAADRDPLSQTSGGTGSNRPRWMIGRVPDATRSLKTWLAALACQKPKEFGYPHELWTIPLRRACPLIRTVGGASHATSPQQTLAMGDSALQYAALSGG